MGITSSAAIEDKLEREIWQIHEHFKCTEMNYGCLDSRLNYDKNLQIEHSFVHMSLTIFNVLIRFD